MVKALFDTNVLIDYLNGVSQAREELSRYRDKAVSIVTWMEVLVGATPDVEQGTREFLANFAVIPVEFDIAERAVELRKQHRIKLPDAIIWATADRQSMLLVTRNTKDFPSGTPGIRKPYDL